MHASSPPELYFANTDTRFEVFSCEAGITYTNLTKHQSVSKNLFEVV